MEVQYTKLLKKFGAIFYTSFLIILFQVRFFKIFFRDLIKIGSKVRQISTGHLFLKSCQLKVQAFSCCYAE